MSPTVLLLGGALALAATVITAFVLNRATIDAKMGALWTAYSAWVITSLRSLHRCDRDREHEELRRFALRHASLIAGGLLLGWLLGESASAAVVIAGLTGTLPYLWVKREVQKRRKAIDAQLDAAMTSLANSFESSPNLDAAFAIIAEHLPPPICQEAVAYLADRALNKTPEQALRYMSERVRSQSMDLLVMALVMGTQGGGDLSNVLKNAAHVLREISRVEDMLAGKTSEGKMQSWFMFAVPFIFVGMVSLISPEWMRPLFTQPIGIVIVAGAVLLDFMGLLLLRKFTRIEI